MMIIIIIYVRCDWLTPGYLLEKSCVPHGYLVITSQFYLLDTAVFILLDTSWVYRGCFFKTLGYFNWISICTSLVPLRCVSWWVPLIYLLSILCQSGKGRWWDKSGVDLCPSVCRTADTPYRGVGWGGRSSSVSGGGYRRYRESWPDRVYLHSSSSNNLTVELTVCLFVHSFSFTEFVCQWCNFSPNIACL